MSKSLSLATFLCLLVAARAPIASADVHLVASSKTSAEISADRYRIKLRFTPDPEITVWSVLQAGKTEEVGSFPLEGFARSRGSAPQNHPGAPQFISATNETKNEALVFTVLYGSLGGDKHRVVLRFDPSFFSYSLSVVKGRKREITELLYLAGNGNGGEVKYGQGRFAEVRTWTPDLYDVLIPDKGISRLSLPPRGSDDPGYIRGQQAGSPLVSPYVVAVRSGSAWWGVGTIGIPNTYNGIGVVIGRSSFGTMYQTASQASAQEKDIEGPALGFYFGSNADEILASYRASLPPSKTLASSDSALPEWWSRPIYCSWGDQVYTARMREGRLDESHGSRYATEENIDRWLAIAAREKLPMGTVILDLGWMSAYGDFEPNPKHFPDLRGYIEKLHAKGLHVLLWIPMYEATGTLFNLDKTKSDVAAKHPDWLVHTREGKLTDVFDYTNPRVREYLRSRIHHMLSSEGLNADGLKVDFIDRVPNPALSTFRDPSWGVGEAMNARVMELIYTSAKEAKADAFIDSSFVNPLFHAWQDVIRLNDDVSNAVETYWWRAWTASVNGVRLIDGDDWWAMERYFVPLTLAKSAWGIPTLYALEHRGSLGTEVTIGTASGGYPVDISQDSFRQVKAILDVYGHAPADSTQQPTVDPVLQKAGRRYREGPLKGFFAAQTLNFGRVLVAYSPQNAQLTSIADGDVSVPLPDGFLVKRVSAVDFGGNRTEILFKQQDDRVHFGVEDSARGIHSYEIDYEKVTPPTPTSSQQ